MKPSRKFLCLIAFLSAFICIKAKPDRDAEQKNINEFYKFLELKGYDKRTIPRGENGEPVVVTVSAFILDITKIDDWNMDFSAHFYFRQSWVDPRLDGRQDSIILRDEEAIWTPDLFFVEEREGSIHQVMHPNKFVRIKPNGAIQYSAKLGVTFKCPMDLRKHPHDIQKCTLNIESYGHQSSHINLKWKSEGNDYAPLLASDEISMLDYDLVEFQTSSQNTTFQTGTYETLQMKLTFKRKFGFFAIRLYVPFIILVVMASVSFWIKAEERSLRLCLLLVVLYLMVTVSSEANACTPPAPYTKASDVWIGFCVSLVFAVFLEFLMVALIAGKENGGNIKGAIVPNLDLEGKEHTLGTESLKTPFSKLVNIFETRNECNGKRNLLSYRIDKISRIVFPIIFIFFNIIYWSVYCT